MIAGDGDEFDGLFEAGEVIGERFFGGLDRVVFLAGKEGGGAGDGAPVIEDFWDVPDLFVIGHQTDDAEGEVPVLRSFVADAEAAGLAHERGAVNGEVRSVVLPKEEIGQEIGLEVGFVAVALFVDLVFVGVEKIAGGVGVVGAGDFVKGVRREFVVVVEERDEFTGGELEGGVGGGGDVAVFRTEADFDAGVGGGVFLEQRADMGRGRGVVGEAEFPVGISLFADGGDGFGEPLFRSVVDRD